ncbi:glycosyltransferase family 25 protein [Mesorhizobium sp. PAMC28654]|uniref:glycosyltransferase family 25 protein n=1 Tax=Mesorhizobium sp. PAMC28654 TaxID=2880934 RepID=UPI0039B63BBD
MTAEFARLGVAFERVAAIDGRDRPDFDEIQMHANRVTKLRLTGSEIGCLLSHRACWEIIAQGDGPYGAIFEDDVIFSEQAGALLTSSDWIPADAGIVKLETFFNKTIIGRKRIPLGQGLSLSRLYGVHIGTGGYVISRQSARDLIDGTREIGIPVDQVMFNPNLATSSQNIIYQSVPALCAQDQFLGDRAVGLPSLIKAQRMDLLLASGRAERRKPGLTKKIGIEIKRLVGQITDFCRLRQAKVIPFDYRGEHFRPPRTQRRENAL